MPVLRPLLTLVHARRPGKKVSGEVELDWSALMAIPDRTRKILWGRSGNRCAYCRRELVEEGTILSDESVVGDEAHIIGEKPSAARGHLGVGRTDLDEYANLILLCKVHHKKVDDQEEEYPVERLREMKDRHQRWVWVTLGATKKPRLWHMPYAHNPGFVGREAILEEMRRAFHGDDNKPCASPVVQAIHGLGGVGKTQLAIRYAHAHAAEYDGVFWVSADSPERMASDLADLYEVADVAESVAADDVDGQMRAVRAWLESPESGAWLLILDNAENSAALNDYLPTRHRGHMLITSRMRWEQANRSIEVREMERLDSVTLLQQRSRQSDATTDRLAEALGDLPLALAQAGSYLADSGLPIGQYLALFQQRRSELLRRGPGPDDYRLTVYATLDLAMSRIASPDAEKLLSLLVCLAPERIPHSLIDAFFGDPLQSGHACAALRRQSLIRFADGTVEIHRLVQAVGWDRMAAEEQVKHATLAVVLIESRFPRDPADVKTWADCKALHAHATESARRAEQSRGGLMWAAELLDRAGVFAAKQGRKAEAVALMRRSLSIMREIYGEDHPRLTPAVLQLVRQIQEQGDLSTARAFYEHAVKCLPPDSPYLPGILDGLGTLAQQEGKLEEAAEWLNRALKIKESPQGHGAQCLSGTLMNLGDVALETGDVSAARQYHEKALQAVQAELGPDNVGVASPLINLGDIAYNEGLFAEARSLLQRALRVLEKEYGAEHPTIARAAYKLGLVAANQDDIGTAQVSFRLSIIINEKLFEPDNDSIAHALGQLAVLQPVGQLAEARRMLLRARAIHGKTHGGECHLIRGTDWTLRKIEQIEGTPSKGGSQGTGSQAERNFAASGGCKTNGPRWTRRSSAREASMNISSLRGSRHTRPSIPRGNS